MAAAGQEAGEEELGHEGDNNADFLFFFFCLVKDGAGLCRGRECFGSWCFLFLSVL